MDFCAVHDLVSMLEVGRQGRAVGGTFPSSPWAYTGFSSQGALCLYLSAAVQGGDVVTQSLCSSRAPGAVPGVGHAKDSRPPRSP